MLRGTLDLGLSALPFVYGAFTLSRLPFQVIQLGLTSILPVLNPEKPELLGLGSALAATVGISFDFSSSGYLDVSVPQVPSLAGDHP